MKHFAPLLFVTIIVFFAFLAFYPASSTLAQAKPTLSLTQGPTPTHPPFPAGMDVRPESGWTLIHNQTFEGVFPATGWTATDLGGDTYQRFWDDENYRFHLGGWAVWPARGGANGRDPVSGNENYFDNINTRMVYGPFSLADASQADTVFYLWLDTESNNDYLAFEVSHDGINFQEKARWSGSAASWQMKDVYYNDYVGDSSVWVAWRFFSNYQINSRGPWIDDINVWKYVQVATAIPTRTLTPTVTRTKTKTLTPTITKTRTKSATPTITKTRTKSPTPTISPTRTKSATVTKTRTPTKTSTRTITPTPTKSATRTKTATITKTFTPKPTRTRTKTATLCPLSKCTATPTKTRTITLTPTKTKTLTPSITPTKTITPTPTGYCRYDAINYADTWAHGRNPDYPLMSTVGNETGCKCDNCTNFASQVLHAGGRDYTGDYLNHGQDVKDWWFDLSNTNLTSPITWRYVESFMAYAKEYPAEFDVSLKTTDPNLPANITAGDFILLDLGDNETGENIPDDRPDHVRVVVGEGWTSTNIIDYYSECQNSTPAPTPSAVPTSILKMLIDQHCVDRYHVGWNYGIDDNDNKWYIHVK